MTYSHRRLLGCFLMAATFGLAVLPFLLLHTIWTTPHWTSHVFSAFWALGLMVIGVVLECDILDWIDSAQETLVKQEDHLNQQQGIILNLGADSHELEEALVSADKVMGKCDVEIKRLRDIIDRQTVVNAALLEENLELKNKIDPAQQARNHYGRDCCGYCGLAYGKQVAPTSWKPIAKMNHEYREMVTTLAEQRQEIEDLKGEYADLVEQSE